MGIKLNRLKAYRVLNNLHQKDMAQVLDITLNGYNLKENGKCEFTSTEVGLMAKKFNIDPGELFKEENLLC